MAADARANPFNPRLIAAIVTVGVIGFVAMWALIALGPRLASDNNGGGHALSRGATGFAAIVELIDRSGGAIRIDRRGRSADDTLTVLTPTIATSAEELTERLEASETGTVAVILPKWRASRDPALPRPGWVGAPSPAPENPAIFAALDQYYGLNGAPDRWRVGTGPDGTVRLTGPGLAPMGGPGGDVVAESIEYNLFIIADADLVSNRAFASGAAARRALAVFDQMAQITGARSIAWDVTLNGFGARSTRFVELAFTPPFIGITLCLIAAMLLGLVQAAVRFGPALVPARALPLSQRALIDSSTALMVQAQRQLAAGDPWLAHWRAALASRLHAPVGLTGPALDGWIEARRRAHDGRQVPDVALALATCRSPETMVAHAAVLSAIRKELLCDH